MSARILSAALFLLLASAPVFAHADNAEDARTMYEGARVLFDSKRYAEAALQFEAAAMLRPHAVAWFMAGQAWERNGLLNRAADAYARAIALGDLKTDEALATSRLAALEKRLGTLDVRGPEGTRVRIEPNTELPVPARLHAAAGRQKLTIRGPGDASSSRDVELVTGVVTPLELEPRPVPTPAAAPPVVHTGEVSPPSWTTQKTIGVVLAGAGLVSLVGAAALWGSANGAHDDYIAAPTRDVYDRGRSLVTWTNVTLIGGALLVASGAFLLAVPLSRRPSSAALVVTPNGIGLRGSM